MRVNCPESPRKPSRGFPFQEQLRFGVAGEVEGLDAILVVVQRN
jgi:hypothetical protein